jgi:hypothetical protein
LKFVSDIFKLDALKAVTKSNSKIRDMMIVSIRITDIHYKRTKCGAKHSNKKWQNMVEIIASTSYR